ncbi:MAG: GIY-YIG nuclease family protein [Gammaproteobacteria bacterium]|nr:GIY-YIG nuclease family protein [Gammaproteobacteria bacterium]
MNVYFIYIIECSNGSYYIGYTTDMERRYQEHCQGSAKCKYTRSFPPKRLAACWQFTEVEVGDMLRLETQLKKLNKQQKRLLVNNPELLVNYTTLPFTKS